MDRSAIVADRPEPVVATRAPQQSDVYAWRALDELGTAAYYVGAFAEGRRAIERMLAEGNMPPSERARV